ncbi:MAG: hypothetical protein JOZ99_04220, partial [Actinobacteria bacterium]|nr:hypothetical protein [Actinomycetota bacterium]
TYPTDIFESRDPNVQGVYNPRTGTVLNARRLFEFQPPGDGVSVSEGTDGLFGVMDAVTASEFGLPVAKLRPANAAANAPFIAPDAAGMTAGYAAMKTNTDGVTKLANPTSATGYPLTKVDYAMVPTTGVTDATKRSHIAQFLDFAAGAGQQPGALPVPYVPLTSDLKAETLKARDDVLAQNGVNPNPSAATPLTTLNTDQPFTGGDLGATSPDTSGTTGSTAGGSSSYGGSVGNAALTPGTPVGTHPAAAASAKRASSTNGVASGLRNFLGGDHELFLPVLLVLGAVGLIAGPIITLMSQGKLRLRTRPRRRGSRTVRGATS